MKWHSVPQILIFPTKSNCFSNSFAWNCSWIAWSLWKRRSFPFHFPLEFQLALPIGVMRDSLVYIVIMQTRLPTPGSWNSFRIGPLPPLLLFPTLVSWGFIGSDSECSNPRTIYSHLFISSQGQLWFIYYCLPLPFSISSRHVSLVGVHNRENEVVDTHKWEDSSSREGGKQSLRASRRHQSSFLLRNRV